MKFSSLGSCVEGACTSLGISRRMGNSSVTGQETGGTQEDGASPKSSPVVHRVPDETMMDGELQEVRQKKGGISVARYCKERALQEDYKLDSKVLGSGMSGPVQLATGSGGAKYAVKSFKKKGLSLKRQEDLKNEVKIYLTLDHPHVARLMMVYEDNEAIHLVMELMSGGELYDRLAEAKTYNEELAANTTYQMLLAVSYLHEQQIAHRDLKLENFLYESKDTNHLKLIDFGFAKFWDRSTKMSQACGSTHYVAPEVLAKSYTLKADMWSLGVIVFMLLTGSPPFHGAGDSEVLKKIKTGAVHWSSRFKRLSEPAQGFVKSLLVVDPSMRLDAPGALAHPWIKGSGGQRGSATLIDDDIKLSLRKYAKASAFRKAVLSMMAWSLSSEDRAQLRNQFLSFDKDNTGTITHSQMKEILTSLYHIDSAEAEAVFQSMDTDHDDVIAYSEFLAAALQGRIQVHEDVLRRTFERFDKTRAGKISVDDLRTVLGSHFEGSDAESLIREADTNSDGMIDYDEFLAYFNGQDPDGPYGEGDDDMEDLSEMEKKLSSETRAKRRKHTECLAAVVDTLIEREAESSDLDGSPGSRASDISPMRRKEVRRPTV